MAEPDPRIEELFAAGVGVGASRASGSGRDDWQPPSPAGLAGVFPRLEVLELLGQGGMGAVYKARQTHLDRLVALKLLAPRLGAEPAFAERFRREALALARLSHPSIVALHDFGEAGPWRYLVMEFVDGATLRHALATGVFSPRAALALAPQLCDALAYAHAQGVVHRDLKPENILLDAQGRAHIADFGLAKLAQLEGESEADSITRTGERIGTAAYMAPEQIAGSRTVDHRADLYALGVVLYEMLTGNLPLGRFEPPSRRVRVDVRIDEVVLRALERVPEQRWQSAGEVSRAVAAASSRPPRSRGMNLAVVAALCVSAALIGAAVMHYAPAVREPRAAMQVTTEAAPKPIPQPAEVAVTATPTAVAPSTAPTSQWTVTAKPTVRTVAEVALPSREPVAAPLLAAPADGRSLVVAGSGEVIIEIEVGARDLSGLDARGVPGLHVQRLIAEAQAAEPALVALRLEATGAPVRLAVPPDLVQRIRHEGSGTLRLRGLRGERLAISSIGSGMLIATDLAVGRLDLGKSGSGSATLSGHADSFTAALGGTAPGGSATVIVNGSVISRAESGIGAVDARALTAPAIDVSLTGSGLLRLGGHAATLRLALTGTGTVDAPGLAVDHADVTIAGSGNATLGEVQALDATCTGGGNLRYSGNPRLGRIVTGN